MTLSSHGSICALKRSDKSLPSNCRITSRLRVVFGFREEDAVESATRWKFGDEQLNLIPSPQNGFTFLAPERERFRRNFQGSNLRALESGRCPGLSFPLVSGWGRHRFLPFPLSWVRPKTNGGRPGHVSHPATTFFPVDFGSRVRTHRISNPNQGSSVAHPSGAERASFLGSNVY
jgi:hypothetical protein